MKYNAKLILVVIVFYFYNQLELDAQSVRYFTGQNSLGVSINLIVNVIAFY